VAFDFRLDVRSGVPVYAQLVQQVRQAVAVGLLVEGDQLPTVKDAVETLLVSPNTVLKAYRELELDAVIWTRHGVGTFVAAVPAATVASIGRHEALRRRLQRWLADASAAGLTEDAIDGLIRVARQDLHETGAA
jgi:GntR family transcriptional regulator